MDRFFHFLVHFVVRVFNKGEEDNEKVKRFIIYHFERFVRRNPGRKLAILFDLSETGLKHLVCLLYLSPLLNILFFFFFEDYDLVKFIIGCGQFYYPALLGRNQIDL